jgi:hypothetical protein
MNRRRITGLGIVGGIVLIVGGLLVNYGAGVPAVGAQAAPPNPLTVIIDKLDQILTALSGIQEGNHTLRWDTNNPSASRFVTAFTGAVLDKNTGLVWEQAPNTGVSVWANATTYCGNKNVGGTRGWRLPAVAELASLIDPSLPAPFVPAGVFTNIQSDGYWSASTRADSSSLLAWRVDFSNGDVFAGQKTGAVHVWCVRGGMHADQY